METPTLAASDVRHFATFALGPGLPTTTLERHPDQARSFVVSAATRDELRTALDALRMEITAALDSLGRT